MTNAATEAANALTSAVSRAVEGAGEAPNVAAAVTASLLTHDEWAQVLATARAEAEHAERCRWSRMLGYGDGVTEPAVTAEEFSDVWEAIAGLANDHDACPQWCEECAQWEKPRSCGPCRGSGCGPGTALGAYDPCPECGGEGRAHSEYRVTS